MSNPIIIVYQDSDYLSLGPAATQADLDAYCENLAEHLTEKFDRPVHVQQLLGGQLAGRCCPESDEIDEYVTELCQGEGWIDFLPDLEES